jgi:hypothetical protein
LTDEEVNTIVKWVNGGALPGDPKDLPPPVQFPNEDAWTIGNPDLILQTPEHVVPAKGADEWYEVVVPTGLTEDRYVKAIETKPSKDGRFVEHLAVVSVECRAVVPTTKSLIAFRIIDRRLLERPHYEER